MRLREALIFSHLTLTYYFCKLLFPTPLISEHTGTIKLLLQLENMHIFRPTSIFSNGEIDKKMLPVSVWALKDFLT